MPKQEPIASTSEDQEEGEDGFENFNNALDESSLNLYAIQQDHSDPQSIQIPNSNGNYGTESLGWTPNFLLTYDNVQFDERREEEYSETLPNDDSKARRSIINAETQTESQTECSANFTDTFQDFESTEDNNVNDFNIDESAGAAQHQENNAQQMQSNSRDDAHQIILRDPDGSMPPELNGAEVQHAALVDDPAGLIMGLLDNTNLQASNVNLSKLLLAMEEENRKLREQVDSLSAEREVHRDEIRELRTNDQLQKERIESLKVLITDQFQENGRSTSLEEPSSPRGLKRDLPDDSLQQAKTHPPKKKRATDNKQKYTPWGTVVGVEPLLDAMEQAVLNGEDITTDAFAKKLYEQLMRKYVNLHDLNPEKVRQHLYNFKRQYKKNLKLSQENRVSHFERLARIYK